MYYEVHGSGDPVVLLHDSFMTITNNWTRWIGELSKTRKVIAVEMQGHGRTADSKRDFSYENRSFMVAKELDTKGLSIKYLFATKVSVVITILVVVVLLLTSCDAAVHSDSVRLKPEQSNQTPGDVAALCERIKDIQVLPHKDGPITDEALKPLLDAGEKVIPCLIKKITDTEGMTDPRQAPKVGQVRVGDVAYFVLLRVTNLDFVELLPLDVRKKYEVDGIYGYFEVIDEGNNRQELQNSAYKWYGRSRGD